MADKSLLELPLATTGAGALIYGVQDNVDKAFPASVLQGSESPQPANTVYAGPTAPPGNFPTFRPLVANDIPDLSALYMASTGGSLSNATLNNSTILGGTISGATAVFDEDKFTLRDTTDTTRNGKFNVALPATGTSVTWTLPEATTTLIGRDTADTLTNKKIVLDASTSASAALRITPGQAPSSPINGDVWTTNAGMFAQINNSTVGPFAAATSSTVNSWNGRVGAVTMNSSDVTTALGYTPYNPASELYVNKTGDLIEGDLYILGDFAVRDASYFGGKTDNAGNKIRVINSGAGSEVFLDAVNNDASTYVPMNLNSTGYNFNIGPVNITNALSAGSIKLRSQGGGSVITLRDAADTVDRFYFNHDDYILRINTNQDSGAYNGTAILVYRHSNNVEAGANLHAMGAITAGGGFGPGSDPRLKIEESLKPIDNAVHTLYNLNVRRGKYHDWYNSDNKERYFVMVDDAMKDHAPEVVMEDVIEKDGNSYNAWNAEQMIALLVKSVQELKDEVDTLKEKLNEYSH